MAQQGTHCVGRWTGALTVVASISAWTAMALADYCDFYCSQVCVGNNSSCSCVVPPYECTETVKTFTVGVVMTQETGGTKRSSYVEDRHCVTIGQCFSHGTSFFANCVDGCVSFGGYVVCRSCAVDDGIPVTNAHFECQDCGI